MPAIAAADLIVDLGIFALFLCFLLLRKAWVATLGKLLLLVAQPFDKAEWKVSVFGRGFRFGFAWVADWLRSVNAQALEILGAGIYATDYAAKRLWQWSAYLFEAIGRTVGGIAEWAYGELRHMVRAVMPAYVSARLHPLASKVEWLFHRLAAIEAHPTTIVRPITRLIDPRIGRLEREVDTLSRAVAHTAPALIPLALPVPSIAPGWVRTGIDEVRAQLGRVTRLLTPAGALGLVAGATLASLDLGWLKCRGVTRLGRELCGLGGLLETILNDAIEALIVADLCEFVAALTYAAEQFEPLLLAFVDVEDALIGCRGITAPADLNVPKLSLPPTTGLVLA